MNLIEVPFFFLLFFASQVRVVITDENDCVPEFLQSIYSKDGVPETVTTATSLLQGEPSGHCWCRAHASRATEI